MSRSIVGGKPTGWEYFGKRKGSWCVDRKTSHKMESFMENLVVQKNYQLFNTTLENLIKTLKIQKVIILSIQRVMKGGVFYLNFQVYIYGVGLKIMLDRNELSFNDEVVKVFEYLQIECWNPDYHFLTDKVNDEDCGWVYKSERVEDEFILFLNIIYSTSNNGLRGVIETDMRVDYLSS